MATRCHGLVSRASLWNHRSITVGRVAQLAVDLLERRRLRLLGVHAVVNQRGVARLERADEDWYFLVVEQLRLVRLLLQPPPRKDLERRRVRLVERAALADELEGVLALLQSRRLPARSRRNILAPASPDATGERPQHVALKSKPETPVTTGKSLSVRQIP